MKFLRQLTVGDYVILAMAVAGIVYGFNTIINTYQSTNRVYVPHIKCDISDGYNRVTCTEGE